MSNIKVVSHESVGNSRWLKPQNFLFAAGHNFVPLTMRELASAIHAMPVCLTSTPDGCQLGGLSGLETGENLFVGHDGAWLGTYVPLAYRLYPFVLVRLANGTDALGIREENLVDDGQQGEAFFDEAGNPTPAVQEFAKLAGEHARHLQATQAACSLLMSKGLLEPWPLRIQLHDTMRMIPALQRVSEAKLRELPVPELGELRAAGALMLAYAQLLSMSQVQLLGPLAQKKMASTAVSRALAAEGPGTHGVVSFDNL